MRRIKEGSIPEKIKKCNNCSGEFAYTESDKESEYLGETHVTCPFCGKQIDVAGE